MNFLRGIQDSPVGLATLFVAVNLIDIGCLGLGLVKLFVVVGDWFGGRGRTFAGYSVAALPLVILGLSLIFPSVVGGTILLYVFALPTWSALIGSAACFYNAIQFFRIRSWVSLGLVLFFGVYAALFIYICETVTHWGIIPFKM